MGCPTCSVVQGLSLKAMSGPYTHPSATAMPSFTQGYRLRPALPEGHSRRACRDHDHTAPPICRAGNNPDDRPTDPITCQQLHLARTCAAWTALFTELDRTGVPSARRLAEIACEGVRFRDPFNDLRGIASLRRLLVQHPGQAPRRPFRGAGHRLVRVHRLPQVDHAGPGPGLGHGGGLDERGPLRPGRAGGGAPGLLGCRGAVLWPSSRHRAPVALLSRWPGCAKRAAEQAAGGRSSANGGLPATRANPASDKTKRQSPRAPPRWSAPTPLHQAENREGPQAQARHRP